MIANPVRSPSFLSLTVDRGSVRLCTMKTRFSSLVRIAPGVRASAPRRLAATLAFVALVAAPGVARAQLSRYVYVPVGQFRNGAQIDVSTNFPNGQPDINDGFNYYFLSGTTGTGYISAGPLENQAGVPEPYSIIWRLPDALTGNQYLATLQLQELDTLQLNLTAIAVADNQGGSCITASDCAGTLSCVGGICCNSACGQAYNGGSAGPCQACSVAGGATADGVCTALSGTACDDGNACTTNDTCTAGTCAGTAITCAPPGACQTGACDPASGCTYTPKASGTMCSAAACTAGGAQPASSCDGVSAGCPAPAAATLCGLFVCANGACETSCTSDGDCAAGAKCYAGTCELGPQGAACAQSADCQSAHCVDGHCCDSACTGQCEACDLPAHLGTCTAVVGAPHGSRTACASDGSACAGACDGTTTDACTYPTSACRAASCDAGSGVATLAANCSGGACPAAQTIACRPYVCGGDVCLGTCARDADCASSDFCASGVCVAKLAAATACAADAQCASGHCVDGVCCDSACGGECEACAEPGSKGTCVAVSGAPRGGRAPCGGSGTCAGACDGTARDACAFPGATTTCADAACASGVATAASTCDGQGSCRSGATTTCAPYACGVTGCRSSCASDADCATGDVCVESACVAPPYDAGTTTSDAGSASGGAVPAPGEKSGGCSTAGGGDALFAALALLAALRRRRTLRS